MLFQVLLVLTFSQRLSALNGVRQREMVARKWAPLVLMHPQEHFYPSSVSFFLDHTHPSQPPTLAREAAAANEDDRARALHPLPMGSNSQDSFIIVDHDFDCSACPLPEFLHGTMPTPQYTPPVYAVIHSCPPVHNHPSHTTIKRDGGGAIRSSKEHSLLEGRMLQGNKDHETTATDPHHDNFEEHTSEHDSNLQVHTGNSHIHLSSGDNNTSLHVDRDIPRTKAYNSQTPAVTTPSTNLYITSHHHQSQTFKTSFHGVSGQTFKLNNSLNPTQIPKYMSQTEKSDSPGPPSHTNMHSDYVNSNNMQGQSNTEPTNEHTSYITEQLYMNTYPLSESQTQTHEAITSKENSQSTPPVIQHYIKNKVPSKVTDNNAKAQHNGTDRETIRRSHFTTERPSEIPTEMSRETQDSNNELQLNTEKELMTGNRTSRELGQPQREVNSEQEERRPNGNVKKGQIFTVTYWMFYPYNQGKDVCTINLGFFGRTLKPRLQGHCHGDEITMGNHVGDWEHISIQFKGNTPIQMYVSTHTFGAFYKYRRGQNQFVYSQHDTREGIPLSPSYPRLLHVVDSRPLLYSAKGSHGLWAAPGMHQYNQLPLLQDETGKGTAWKTWLNLQVVDEASPHSVNQHKSWWRYEGRWGNPGTRCYLLMAGLCEVVKGPTGIPRKRQNFPCHYTSP